MIYTGGKSRRKFTRKFRGDYILLDDMTRYLNRNQNNIAGISDLVFWVFQAGTEIDIGTLVLGTLSYYRN